MAIFYPKIKELSGAQHCVESKDAGQSHGLILFLVEVSYKSEKSSRIQRDSLTWEL